MFAEQLANGLTYKPGWEFIATGVNHLVIRLHTQDSLDPDLALPGIPVNTPLAGLDLPEAVAAVFERIRGIEDHERHEWLRLGGLCVTKQARRNHPGWPIDSVPWAT